MSSQSAVYARSTRIPQRAKNKNKDLPSASPDFKNASQLQLLCKWLASRPETSRVHLPTKSRHLARCQTRRREKPSLSLMSANGAVRATPTAKAERSQSCGSGDGCIRYANKPISIQSPDLTGMLGWNMGLSKRYPLFTSPSTLYY